MIRFPAYQVGDAYPGLMFPWETEVAPGVFEPLDLQSGYTFTLELLPVSGGAPLSPAVELVGLDGAVQADWTVTALQIPPDQYRVRVRALETATSKLRTWSRDNLPTIEIRG